MSVKDIKNYYNEVAQQYQDMCDELKDFSKLVEQNMFDSDRLEKIKESIQPLMRNYEMLSYIMFLLNKPNRKEKVASYEKRNKKLISKIPDYCKKENVLKENENAIKDMENNMKI